ncbi:SNF1-interacting protein, partial [Nowakowskiella sp. JEL0078]
MVSGMGKNRGLVLGIDPINVLLCNVRPVLKEDRRFCFEVQTVRRNYLVQAESDEEMNSWIKAFSLAQNAIPNATEPILDQNLKVNSEKKENDDEDEDGEKTSLLKTQTPILTAAKQMKNSNSVANFTRIVGISFQAMASSIEKSTNSTSSNTVNIAQQISPVLSQNIEGEMRSESTGVSPG